MSRQFGAEPGVLSWSARVFFTGIAVAAFWLGVFGFGGYLPADSGYGRRPVDLMYYSLQNFVLGAAPLQDGNFMKDAPPIPVSLEIARFAAPAVTIYLIFLALAALFAEGLMQLRIWFSSGHSVLCGPQDTIQELADQIQREAGGKVVIVDSAAQRSLRRGFLHVIGDPRERRTLERAGLSRARELIAVGPDSVLNAEVAIAVHAINRAKETKRAKWARLTKWVKWVKWVKWMKRPAICYAEALKPELFQAVVGQVVDEGEVNRLDVFNRHDRTARELLEHFPPALPSDPPSAVLVIGYGGLGQILVDHLARYWSDGAASGAAPRLGVLDADAPAEVVSRDHGDTGGRVAIAARRHDPEWLATIDDLLVPAADGTSSVPGCVYVCLDDDATGIAVGDTALRLLAGHESTIIVAVPNSAVLGYPAGVNGPAEPASDRRPGDEPSGPPASRTVGRARLLLISVVQTVYSIEAIRNGTNEQLAKAIHETYCDHVTASGDSVQYNESIRPWEKLPEYLKDSNRDQAWDIRRKLSMINLGVVPGRGGNGRITFTEKQVEMLAKIEHERWMDERKAKGWRYGVERDNKGKRHPDLVDWLYLSPGSQEKDRSAVRTIPEYLAKAGLEIIRTKAP